MFNWNWQVVTVLQRAEDVEEEGEEVVDVASDHPLGFTHNALDDEE
jgi:hypothetical protein